MPPTRTWRVATVTAIVRETPTVTTLELDVPDWEGHVAGQHLVVRLTAPDGYRAQRSYSISSSPSSPTVAITVERIGDGEVSPYLTDVLRVGDGLELRGPFGGYFTWRPDDPSPLLLVAGGSGIAPIMSILRHRDALAAPSPATLLYSSRSWDDVISRDDLDALVAADPTLSLVHTLTRRVPDGWTGLSRRIDAEMLGSVAPSPQVAPKAYVCGPSALVEAVAAGLVTLGYPADRIVTERFGPTGT